MPHIYFFLKLTPLKRPNARIQVYSLEFTSSQVLFAVVRRRRSVALLRWRRQLSGPNPTSTKCAAGADHRVECGYNPAHDRALQQVAEVSDIGWPADLRKSRRPSQLRPMGQVGAQQPSIKYQVSSIKYQVRLRSAGLGRADLRLRAACR